MKENHTDITQNDSLGEVKKPENNSNTLWNKKRLLIGGILLVFLSAVLGLIYMFVQTATPDKLTNNDSMVVDDDSGLVKETTEKYSSAGTRLDTASWQWYINPEKGFSVKLPQGYVQSSDNETEVTFTRRDNYEGPSSIIIASVGVQKPNREYTNNQIAKTIENHKLEGWVLDENISDSSKTSGPNGYRLAFQKGSEYKVITFPYARDLMTVTISQSSPVNTEFLDILTTVSRSVKTFDHLAVNNNGYYTYGDVIDKYPSPSGYKLNIPNNWNLLFTESELSGTIYHKQDYVITFGRTIEGSRCLFNQPKPEGEDGLYTTVINKEYKEINGTEVNIRRFEVDDEYSEDLRYSTCYKSGDQYSIGVLGLSVRYSTPQTPNSSILEEMDTIIGSISRVN